MTPGAKDEARTRATLATSALSVHPPQADWVDLAAPEQCSGSRQRERQLTALTISHCALPGRDRSRTPTRRAAGPESLGKLNSLERAIMAECAAWIALLEAVPDFRPDRALNDLTPVQLELVGRYLTAHAERIDALR
jgi:hypothetical protein